MSTVSSSWWKKDVNAPKHLPIPGTVPTCAMLERCQSGTYPDQHLQSPGRAGAEYIPTWYIANTMKWVGFIDCTNSQLHFLRMNTRHLKCHWTWKVRKPHEVPVHIIITLRPRQNGRHFTDDILKCIFLNENVWISPKISLKFVPKVKINTIPLFVQRMAWHRPCNKPLSEPMMVSLLTHIWVTLPPWVNSMAPLE